MTTSLFPEPSTVLQAIIPEQITSEQQLNDVNNNIDNGAKELTEKFKKIMDSSLTANVQGALSAPSLPQPQIKTPSISGVGGVEQFLPSPTDFLQAKMPFFLAGLTDKLSSLQESVSKIAESANKIATDFSEQIGKIEPAAKKAKELARQKLSEYQAAQRLQQMQAAITAATAPPTTRR